MEISSKELREVEFRERLRGYDTTEVDEFLERVAIAVDEMQGRARELAERAERAERADRPAREKVGDDEDTLRRTLVLAQRTADMAIREAQEEAAQLLERARAEGESILDDAAESARRMTNDAQRALQAEVERLTGQRDQLRADVRTLADLLDNERERLAEALGSALRWVERSFAPAPELAAHRSAPLSREGTDAGDDVESQIEEDAAAAATPSAPPEGRMLAAAEDVDVDGEEGEELEGADELAGDEPAGAAPSALARLRPEPARLGGTSSLRDTQVWRLDEPGADAGWPA